MRKKFATSSTRISRCSLKKLKTKTKKRKITKKQKNFTILLGLTLLVSRVKYAKVEDWA